METSPASTPAQQPNWPLLLLCALLAGAAVYALYHAFASQAAFNQQLARQNAELKKRVARLEAVQSTHVKTTMLDALKAEIAENSSAQQALIARLAAVEKTVTAPAPVIEFAAPVAGAMETLQQFVALKTAVEKGVPYSAALATASAIPEVASIREVLEKSAQQGVASDSKLRDALSSWLEAHPATIVVEDPQFADLNARLKGLLSIKRKQQAPSDPYAILRKQLEAEASLDLLITSATDLPSEARAPIADWISQATERQAAIAALRAAETTLAGAQR
jgi:hypothetical protein